MHIFAKRNKEKKDSKSEKRDVPFDNKPVLGVALSEAVENDKCFDDISLPAVVRDSIDYVTDHGTELEGIYRVSPNKSRLDELEALVNSGSRKDAPKFSDAHEAAGLLKRFLRQLPEHILTPQLRPSFDAVTSRCSCNSQEACKCAAVDQVKELLQKLPHENYCLLAYVFRHAHLIIQKQKYNKMGLAALGVLLQAMLNLSRNEVRIFLLNASSADQITPLFTDVEFKRYVRPKTLAELVVKVPDNVAEIESEIEKQKNLLTHLNRQCLNDSTSFAAGWKNTLLTETKEALNLLQKSLASLKKIDEVSNVTVFPPNEIASQNINCNATSSDSDNIVSSALLEKQLLAVNTSLKDEIADEKRKITQLLSRLREVQNQLPPNVVKELSSSKHKRTASSVSAQSVSSVSRTSTENILEKCAAEERRREDLLAEVARLRNLCAELRAHLEHDTVVLNNARSAANVASYPGLLTVSIATQQCNSPRTDKPPIISPKPSPRTIATSPAVRTDVVHNSSNGVSNNSHESKNQNVDDEPNHEVVNGNVSDSSMQGNRSKVANTDALLVTRF